MSFIRGISCRRPETGIDRASVHGSRGTRPPLLGGWPLWSYAWVGRCGRVQDTGLGRVQAPIAAGAALMAQKVAAALEDDLTGGPAAETVRFAVDDMDYEIDLSAKSAATFSKL